MGTSVHTGANARSGVERGSGPAVRTSATAAPRRPAGEYGGDRVQGEGLSDFLGWFSVGLGVAQLVAPGSVARLIGASDSDRSRTIMRACGLRELASGLGILSRRRPTRWVQGRVAGDLMDLALLGAVMASSDERERTAAATAAVLGVAALDVLAARQLDQASNDVVEALAEETRGHGIHTKRSITVRRPVSDVYAFWRDLENLPRFMRHLESVRVLDDRRSHWRAKAPAGQSVEWDAELTEDVPDELIAWRAVGDADVYNEGTVRFAPAPADRGTEVHVDLRYEPPGGVVGSKLAMLFREEPGQQIQDDLRHFKQVMELGEIVLSDATARRGPHPARPSAKPVEL